MANSPYSYRAGPNTLGIGVENMALLRPGVAVDQPNYGPRYEVRGSINPFMGGAFYPVAPHGPYISLRADGVYLSGQMALQALADFEKANS